MVAELLQPPTSCLILDLGIKGSKGSFGLRNESLSGSKAFVSPVNAERFCLKYHMDAPDPQGFACEVLSSGALTVSP